LVVNRRAKKRERCYWKVVLTKIGTRGKLLLEKEHGEEPGLWNGNSPGLAIKYGAFL